VSRPASSVPFVAVACMKLVELRAGVDPLTGDVVPNPGSAGPSAADMAALEWALRIAEAAGGGVVAVTAGGPECDSMLRGALAAGAMRAVRVPLDADAGAAPSTVVARALARAVASVVPASAPAMAAAPPGVSATPAPPDTPAAAAGMSAVVVCCGDASMDRGSGSVPAFLAGELQIAQALGLIRVSLAAWRGPDERSDPADSQGAQASIEGERRLDRGRRERLRLTAPFVMSVEAGTARLRRASLQRSLASRDAVVEVLSGEPSLDTGVEVASWGAYRPRTRVVAPPQAGLGPRGRIAALAGALHERPAARTLVLDAEAAADEMLSALAEWGEVPAGVVIAEPKPDPAEVP
jgi:electron transfer flavoprotein beta subunit